MLAKAGPGRSVLALKTPRARARATMASPRAVPRAGLAQEPAAEAVNLDFGEMHVTSGEEGQEGLYFSPKSKLIQRLLAEGSRFNRCLKRRSQFLRAPWWGRNGHSNTLVAHAMRSRWGSQGEGYQRTFIKTRDGGTISVDLTSVKSVARAADNDDSGELLAAAPATPDHKAPFVVMIAGLGGSSADPYTQGMTTACARRGWRSCVINMRGTGDGPVTSGRLFSARRGSTEDVRHVVSELRASGVVQPDQPVFGIGWSLGGCIMSNTVLEQDELAQPPAAASRIAAAAALGAPYDLHASSQELVPFPHRLYSENMGRGLLRILKRVAHNFNGVRHNFLGEEGFRFDEEKTFAAKSILDFDEALTAPFFGFKSAREYYDYSSPGRRFTATSPSVPMVLVSAMDDPVVGRQGIPFEAARANENLLVVATANGGHLGWCEGLTKGCGFGREPSWTEDVVLDFLNNALEAGVHHDTTDQSSPSNVTM